MNKKVRYLLKHLTDDTWKSEASICVVNTYAICSLVYKSINYETPWIKYISAQQNVSPVNMLHCHLYDFLWEFKELYGGILKFETAKMYIKTIQNE